MRSPHLLQSHRRPLSLLLVLMLGPVVVLVCGGKFSSPLPAHRAAAERTRIAASHDRAPAVDDEL